MNRRFGALLTLTAMSFDMLKSETNLEEGSLPSGSSQAKIQSIRNTCFHLSLHAAESEDGQKSQRWQWGRRKIPGAVRTRTLELAAASHLWFEHHKKNDPKLINRTRDKTVQKKGEPHSFSGVRRQALL